MAGFNLCTNTLSNNGFKLLTDFKKDIFVFVLVVMTLASAEIYMLFFHGTAENFHPSTRRKCLVWERHSFRSQILLHRIDLLTRIHALLILLLFSIRSNAQIMKGNVLTARQEHSLSL